MNGGCGSSIPAFSIPSDPTPIVDLHNVKLPQDEQLFNTSLISPLIANKVFHSTRSREDFEKVGQIGEGTYGKVYKAKDKMTEEIVALKKIKMHPKEGFPITAIREIKILRQLNHEHVIRLKEIVASKKRNIFMVLEYMDFDLSGITKNRDIEPLTPAQVKAYMKQLLEGLHYCHEKGILHRDLKLANILINNRGYLKLADFGLARYFQEDIAMTNNVITRWYRPPEILLGATKYTTAADMWSIGCIFAELLIRQPILPGRNEYDQLDRIFILCGTPDAEGWDEAQNLDFWDKLAPKKSHSRKVFASLKKLQNELPGDALDMIDRLLVLDPTKRLTAREALDHEYFKNLDVQLLKPSELPQFSVQSCHDYIWKMQNRKKDKNFEIPPQDSLREFKKQKTSHEQSKSSSESEVDIASSAVPRSSTMANTTTSIINTTTSTTTTTTTTAAKHVGSSSRDTMSRPAIATGNEYGVEHPKAVASTSSIKKETTTMNANTHTTNVNRMDSHTYHNAQEHKYRSRKQESQYFSEKVNSHTAPISKNAGQRNGHEIKINDHEQYDKSNRRETRRSHSSSHDIEPQHHPSEQKQEYYKTHRHHRYNRPYSRSRSPERRPRSRSRERRRSRERYHYHRDRRHKSPSRHDKRSRSSDRYGRDDERSRNDESPPRERKKSRRHHNHHHHHRHRSKDRSRSPPSSPSPSSSHRKRRKKHGPH